MFLIIKALGSVSRVVIVNFGCPVYTENVFVII